MRIGFIGAGRMGWALAKLFSYFGDEILFVSDIVQENAWKFAKNFSCQVLETGDFSQIATQFPELELLCLSVVDDQIELVSQSLSLGLSRDVSVFHTSGALSSEIIRKHLPQSSCASLHPLAPCPLISSTIEENLNFYRGLFFTLEGDVQAVERIKTMLTLVEGNIILLRPEDKIKYHAAAVFASNYPLILIEIAANLFVECGFGPEEAEEAAKSLFLRAAQNLSQTTKLIDALTGPAKRGDGQTIAKHLKVLENDEDLKQLYHLLLQESLRMLGRKV